MRLEQVATPRTDKALRDFVAHAVRDVDDNPDIALSGVRGIVTRAQLIWEAELPQDQMIPAGWIHESEASASELPKRPR